MERAGGKRATTTERVRKHLAALRKKGFKKIEIWVPDTQAEAFLKEARRQSRLAAKADRSDDTVQAFACVAASSD